MPRWSGGVDSLCLTTLYGFHSLQLVSRTPCRPFDAARDGISIGEAAAFALLERVPASCDAGSVLLLGTGESSDAYHMSAPPPARARRARRHAGRARRPPGSAAADIDYINLHGTGTPSNDAAEARAVAAVLGARVPGQLDQGRDRPHARRRRRARGGDLRARAAARAHARAASTPPQRRSGARGALPAREPPRAAQARAEQLLRLRRLELQPDPRAGRMSVTPALAAYADGRRDSRARAPRLAGGGAGAARRAPWAERRRPCCPRRKCLPPAPSGAAPGAVVKLALAVGLEACRRRRGAMPRRCRRCSPPRAATASNCHEICQALASAERLASRPPAFTTRCTMPPPATGASPPGRRRPRTRCAPTMRASGPGCSRRSRQVAAEQRSGTPHCL